MSRRRIVFVALFALAATFGRLRAEDQPSYGPGTKIDSFTVGTTTYRNVRIRSVNAHTVFFMHSGGFSSVHLRDLAPEWQARFHYDPAADAAEPAPVAPPPRRHAPPVVRKADSSFDRLLREFGEPAELQDEVDMRPKFFSLELAVKDQGRRPSCAIFAIVSALELQDAELTGSAQEFSDAYLIWATRRIIQRVLRVPIGEALFTDDADVGFSLGEVVEGLRAYGIPLQSSLPNTFGGMNPAEDPPPDVVAEARAHRRVAVHRIPGRDNTTRLNNIVQALNAGVPVPIGTGWPSYRTIRGGYLSEQAPIGGHAVTLVGYRSPDRQLEHAVFYFKNSWGVAWGQGGYGLATFAYLERNLEDAVVIELQSAGGE